MRTDAVRFATNSSERPLPALRYDSIRNGPEHATPHGLTARRVSRLVFCAEEAAQPIKGYSSEITARDSLRPGSSKANQSSSGRG